MMGTLMGYAVNTGVYIGWTRLDHTYVRSTDGYGPWPCPWLARSSGGARIASGAGSGRVANCLSQPLSGAGIVYGVHGVCHQMANRILVPARVTVYRAGGYWLSRLIYGTYGSYAWVWFATRGVYCALWASPPLPRPKGRGKHQAHMERVNAMYNEAASKALEAITRGVRESEEVMERKEEEFVAEDVKLMIEHRLGADFDPKKVKAILKLRADFVKEKRNLDKALASRGRSGKQAALDVDRRFGQLLKRLEKVLGSDDYKELFGVSLDESFTLVDPEIAGSETSETGQM